MAIASPVVLSSILNLSSGVIALLVSYYAFRARRVVETSVLNAFSFGFMLLGAALVVEAVIGLSLGLTAAEAVRVRVFDLLENLAYLVLQVIALAIIAVGYYRTVYGKPGAETPGLSGLLVYATTVAQRSKLTGLLGLLFYLYMGLEFAILFVLIFIVFHCLLVYSNNHDSSSLLVLLGFALIFLAHVVVLQSLLNISGSEYLIATAVQSGGFLSLLAFVIRSGRIGST